MVRNGQTVIESLGVYLPSTIVSTAETLFGCKHRVMLPLEKLTGISSRHVTQGREYAVDLARHAIERCLARSRYEPDDIDLLIACNICRYDGPDLRFSFEPNTSFQLARELGFTNATTFDVSNACAGFFTAVAVANAYINEGTARRALIVSGEYISHVAETAQKEIRNFADPRVACLTLGDAGAALILEPAPSPEVGILDLEMYTLSEHAQLCIARPSDEEHGGIIMLTDPIVLSATTVNAALPHALGVLRRNNWSVDHLDHLVMHQTSRLSLKQAVDMAERQLGRKLPKSLNVVDNLTSCGNTATTSHILALACGIEAGDIRSGDRVLFSSTGSGLTIGTTLYAFDGLPDRIRSQEMAAQARPMPAALRRQRGPARARISSVAAPAPPREDRDSIAWAVSAARKCLASHRRLEAIELLIFCGVYRSGFIFEPAIAALIAGELKKGWSGPAFDKTLAFDVFNGSIGFLNACDVATQLIRGDGHCAALVLTSEIENDVQREFGQMRHIVEMAAVVLLERAEDGSAGFGSFLFRNFPKYAEAFIAHGSERGGKAHVRFTGSPDLTDAYLECIPDTVEELLEREKMSLGDVAVVLGPQVGRAFSARLADMLGLPRDKLVTVGPEGADLFTSSFPCSINHVLSKGFVNKGDIGLVIGAGPGVQVGCTTYLF